MRIYGVVWVAVGQLKMADAGSSDTHGLLMHVSNVLGLMSTLDNDGICPCYDSATLHSRLLMHEMHSVRLSTADFSRGLCKESMVAFSLKQKPKERSWVFWISMVSKFLKWVANITVIMCVWFIPVFLYFWSFANWDLPCIHQWKKIYKNGTNFNC